MQSEEWRAIPQELGYEASTWGRICSVDRVIETSTGPRHYKGKILSPGLTQGHLTVCLGGRRTRYVHHLILETFVGPRGEQICRHLDDVGVDNRPENLAWGTYAENSRDNLRLGNHPKASMVDCIRGHPLRGANLRVTRKGTRECRSCNAGRGAVRGGRADSIQTYADEFYWRLIG